MPWLETNKVEQRLRFVLAVREDGEPISRACRRFGVTRPTAYKWLRRYDSGGLNALEDQPRIARKHPHTTPLEVVEEVLRVRERFGFGPAKIRGFIRMRKPELVVPAASTIGSILKRHGLVVPRKRRRRSSPQSEPFGDCAKPNDTWAADFKGQFSLGNRSRCYPLTITDAHSRFLLACRAQRSTV